MTEDQVRALLKRACERAGSQTAWAKAHGVTGAYVGDVLSGRREPGPGILRGLGIVRVVTYRRERKGAKDE